SARRSAPSAPASHRRRGCSAGRTRPGRAAAAAAARRETGPGATRTSRRGRAGAGAQRPPPPPPPPPPPEKPPPPPPELLPGGLADDAICAPSALPMLLVKRPMSALPRPWYQAMPDTAAAAAALPTAAVNFAVQAFSTPSATA